MRKLVYYAHCIALYGTVQELRDLETLNDLGFQVYNPNNPHAQVGYETQGMEWFFKRVRECQALAFRALPDGSIPAGVFGEVNAALAARIPVFELPGMISRRGLTVDQTREYIREVGKR